MRKRIIALTAAIVLLGGSLPITAAIVELPLDCAGQYEFLDTWSTTFDLGVTFTEISNVYIDWSGEIIGEETMNAGIIDAQFIATLYELDPLDYFGRAYVQGGADTYPDPEPFALQSPFIAQDWSMLLDGNASIEIWFGDTHHPLDLVALSPPSGTLDSASLVVEGTIIPEPATIVFFAIGALLLRKRY